jgi:hypothetical protein
MIQVSTSQYEEVELPWNQPFSQQPLTKSMNLNNHSPI